MSESETKTNKTMSNTLDISKLSAEDRQALMAQLEAEAKADKQKKESDRKAYKELTHDFVNRNIDSLLHHNDVTGIIIEKLFADYSSVKALKEQVYGRHQQDSHTSTLPDGSASITIGKNVTIQFDGTEASGLEKIKNYIKSLSDNTNDERIIKLAKMTNTLIKVNPKTQQPNPSKIIELSKLSEEFNSEEFDDGLDIIFKAQIRTQNSMYVSGWKVVEVDGVPKKLSFRFSV